MEEEKVLEFYVYIWIVIISTLWISLPVVILIDFIANQIFRRKKNEQ